MPQDAQEFLNYLLNECSELLEKEAKVEAQATVTPGKPGAAAANSTPPAALNGFAAPAGGAVAGDRGAAANGAHVGELSGAAKGTFVHELFQGKLVSETRCLQCETVTNREEAIMDLSLEIEQNSSITACLRNFRCTSQLRLCLAAMDLSLMIGINSPTTACLRGFWRATPAAWR